jgi:hypothetical protein
MAPTLDQLRSEVWAWPARSSQVRASWTSSFERKKDLALSGVPGQLKGPRRPTGRVVIALMMNIHL